MNEIDNLFSQAQQISEEIRRLQTVADSWPDKDEAGMMINRRNALQVLMAIYMEKICVLETKQV